uniref:G domain-containing protein n=1 Tax=Mycena chlorophos TaxID=658473 RepID=A0ABQ0LBQ3_MYCCL|nr:predicted protein [Mycena chlorophos]
MASVVESNGSDSLTESPPDGTSTPSVDRPNASPKTMPDEPDCPDPEAFGAKTRILVAGRVHSGKKTLLERVCGPFPHDLQLELVHDRYIFHYFRGFEGARDSRISTVNQFLRSRAETRTFTDQVHVIWYFVRTDTHMYMSPGDERFFSENLAQNVPVIVLFTKYDLLVTLAFGDLRRTMGRLEAKEKRFQRAREFLQLRYIDRLNSFPFPPTAFVQMDDLSNDNLNTDTLFQTTKDVTSAQRLAPILRSVRQNNLDSCLEDAVAAAIDAKDVAAVLLIVLRFYPHVWLSWNYEVRFVGFSSAAPDILRQRPYEQAVPAQNAADCTAIFCDKIPSENSWTNARRSEAIAAACICIDQTFMEASACAADFPAAFQIALDAYFSVEHTPRSIVNKEIAKFSPQDYREVVDPGSSEQQLTRKAVLKLVEIIKAHRLRLRDE